MYSGSTICRANSAEVRESRCHGLGSDHRYVINTANPSSTSMTIVCRVKNCRRNDSRNTCKQAAKVDVLLAVSMLLFRARGTFHQVVEHRLGRGVGGLESLHLRVVPNSELAELGIKPARVLHL